MFGKRGMASLVFVSCLLGCDPSGAVIGTDVADFATMRELWLAQGIDDYYVEYTASSEWVQPFTLGIEVRDGEATRVRGTANPSVDALAWRSPDAWERRLVMDSMYVWLATEMADPGATVVTRFDTRIGLLSSVYVDRPAWADDSYGYSVKRFVRQ